MFTKLQGGPLRNFTLGEMYLDALYKATKELMGFNINSFNYVQEISNLSIMSILLGLGQP
jgi:hypothetical protein